MARSSKLPGPTADRRCSLAIISGARLRVDGGSTTPRPSPGRGRARQRSRQRAVPLPAHSCSTRPRRQSQSRVRTRYDQQAAKSGFAMPCVVTAGWLFSSAVPAPPRYPSPNSNECGIDNHCSKGRGIRRRDDAAEPCSESTAGHTGCKRQYGMQRWHPNNPSNSAQYRRLCHRPPGSAGATATSRSGSGNLLTPDRCCNSRHHFPFLCAPPVALPDAAALRHCTSCDLPIERGWLGTVAGRCSFRSRFGQISAIAICFPGVL